MTQSAVSVTDHIDDLIIDRSALGRWMDEQGLPSGPITDLRVLTGGTQNTMVRFKRGDREFVLRRGPRHLRPTSNKALRREICVCTALAQTSIPHPAVLASCDDEHVLGGSVFFLMAAVDGVNLTVDVPAPYRSAPAIRNVGPAAVDALLRIGEVDHHELGLSDLGRPDGFLDRQVPRWLDELSTYSQHAGYPAHPIPHVDEVARWLTERKPAGFRPGLLHGDFHVGNLMFSPRQARVAAVVDWEMATIGDPLVDMGWLLATWPQGDAVDEVAGPLAGATGLASAAQLRQRFTERSTRPADSLPWYEVLACFKLGIVLEGTYARSCAGLAPAATGLRMHALTLGLFERATRTMEESA